MGFFKWRSHNTGLNVDPLFKEVFLHSPIATLITDADGIIVLSNKAFSELSGYTKDEMEGERPSLLKSGQHDHAFYQKMWEKLSADGMFEGKIWNRHKNQSLMLVSEKIQRVYHQKKTYYIATFQDITQDHKLIQRYQHLALHDPLTGLANRSLAKDRFNHALSNSIRSGKKLGVILCDLNEFKQVNDQFGHQTGDKVLIEVAKHLSQNLRKGDTVARYGGDEFLIIIENLNSADELVLLMNQLSYGIKVKIFGQKQLLEVSCSAGASCFPEDGTVYEQLFQAADNKLYEQKNKYYGYDFYSKTQGHIV